MVKGILLSEKFNPYEDYRFKCPNFYWIHITCVKCQCNKCKFFKEITKTKPYPRIECWRKKSD